MMRRLAPWLVGVAVLCWFTSGHAARKVLPLVGLPSAPPDRPQLYSFGQIPVYQDGRLKPMDTVARTYLRILSGVSLLINNESFVDRDAEGKVLAKGPAIEWLLDVMVGVRSHQVIRIDNPQLVDSLGLKRREGNRYALTEFEEQLGSIVESVKSAHDREKGGRPLDAYEHQLLEFEKRWSYHKQLETGAIPQLAVPSRGDGPWKNLRDALLKSPEDGAADPYIALWRDMLASYRSKDWVKFNGAVSTYLDRLRAEHPAQVDRTALESRFNYLDLFNIAKWLYLLVFVLSFLACLGWERTLNRGAWWLLVGTFLLHCFALGARMYLSGRPPVTNLYSSGIFIGWGAVALCIVLERIFRVGAGNMVAAIAGFLTLIISHILAADGDTMIVLQAVLDTQFWLATHVTCITLGYATTFVAGLLGIIFLVRGVLSRTLTQETATKISKMTYGVVCFAMFFSFVGTVLGGLWADDSWGRFWGWDPKENGALMIVLWNALVLHARWGGLVRERGLAALTVIGNIVVSWSWFGVNQLGKGLHAYGFTTGVTEALWAFAASQLLILGLAFVPPSRWRSPLAPRGASGGANGG